jgi:ACS family hexuronate transporter-like MFS transporter
MAHGLATGWLGFAGLRGALGVVEGAAQPAGMKVVSEWFPARERGLAGGILQHRRFVRRAPRPAAGRMGRVQSRLARGLPRHRRTGARLADSVAVLVCAAARHRAIGDHERTPHPRRSGTRLAGKQGRPLLRRLLRRRELWAIAAARFLADPVWGMLSLWMPLYLTTVRHFDLKQIALFAWLPFLAADLGCLFGPGGRRLAPSARHASDRCEARGIYPSAR